MKKFISIALAMMFILIASLSVSAASIPSANQINNVADGNWKGGNGSACFGYNPEIATELYMIADGNGKVFNWWATYKTPIEPNVISADFSPKANVGFFFGATETILTAANLNNKNDCCKYLRYYFANINYDVANDTYTLLFLNDNQEFGTSVPLKSNTNNVVEAEVALDKATYGINGTDDINLKVDFTAAGDVKIYVNGIKVVDKTGLAPYGENIGIIAPTTEYGTEKAR